MPQYVGTFGTFRSEVLFDKDLKKNKRNKFGGNRRKWKKIRKFYTFWFKTVLVECSKNHLKSIFSLCILQSSSLKEMGRGKDPRVDEVLGEASDQLASLRTTWTSANELKGTRGAQTQLTLRWTNIRQQNTCSHKALSSLLRHKKETNVSQESL